MTSLASLRARLKRIEQQRAARGDDGPLARMPISELWRLMYRDSDPEFAERGAQLFEELEPECATEQELLERAFDQLYPDPGPRTGED